MAKQKETTQEQKPKVTRKAAGDLLEAGYITQEQYDSMFADGVVSAGSRSSRPAINIPNEHKAAFADRAYDALTQVAREMEFDHTVAYADGGTAVIYIKGSGKPRSSDS